MLFSGMIPEEGNMRMAAVVVVLLACALCAAGRAWGIDEFYGSSRTERTLRSERTDRGEWTDRTDRTDRPLRAYEEENVPANDVKGRKPPSGRKTPVFKEW